jgi:hypothetical protein
MRYYHHILKNITPLNMILAVVLLIFFNNLFPFIGGDTLYRLPEPVKRSETSQIVPYRNPITSLSDYMVIADRNPFNPERIIPKEREDKNLHTNQPLKTLPSFALYGTIITDEQRMAIVEDRRAPSLSKGRRKNIRVLRVGDELSGFVLKKISPDKIVMNRGEEEVTVPLYTQNKPVSNKKFRFPTGRGTR